MKIKNEYVKVKCGKKEFKKHNFFVDDYLTIYSKSQLIEHADLNDNKFFDKVYLKLDEPLQGINRSSIINENLFEVKIENPTYIQTGTENQVSIIYTFDNTTSFYYNGNLYTDYSILIGHKITAISFNCLTFIDTNDYNLYIEDEILEISRKDTFSSDAICIGYDYPYHLAPKLDTINDNNVYATLYSVGVGILKGKMANEFIINEDIRVKEDNENTFSFILNKGSVNVIFPSNSLYPSINIKPLTLAINTSNYPSPNFYAGYNVFPLKGDYKYIIMKYKLFYIENDEIIYLDKEYTMNYYNDKDGIIKINTKIERNEKYE